jgi:hypothetical protein
MELRRRREFAVGDVIRRAWSISTSVSPEMNPIAWSDPDVQPHQDYGSRTTGQLVSNCSRTCLHDRLTSYRQVSLAPDIHVLLAHDMWLYWKLIVIGDMNCGLSFLLETQSTSVDSPWRWRKLQWCVRKVFLNDRKRNYLAWQSLLDFFT